MWEARIATQIKFAKKVADMVSFLDTHFISNSNGPGLGINDLEYGLNPFPKNILGIFRQDC